VNIFVPQKPYPKRKNRLNFKAVNNNFSCIFFARIGAGKMSKKIHTTGKKFPKLSLSKRLSIHISLSKFRPGASSGPKEDKSVLLINN